jgi:hypothetical protein
MMLTLLILTAIYLSVPLVISLIIPYYAYSDNASLSDVFIHIGWNWASYIVTFGAITSLVTW